MTGPDPTGPDPTGQDADAAAGERPDLAEETRRIVAVVQDWMRRGLPEPHGGPECQWCPICQLARALRGERPEVADKLADAGTAIAGALRALVDAAAAHTGDVPTRGADDRPRPSPRVQKITLDDPPDGSSA